MRLWTLHPRYLDSKGLTALWREGLLAQKVLQRKTIGYRRHPQLSRFLSHPRPVAAIATYLAAVLAEAKVRGYRFDAGKIGRSRIRKRIAETRGQLLYERSHLARKLFRRDRLRFFALKNIKKPDPHPIFRIVSGGVREWERIR